MVSVRCAPKNKIINLIEDCESDRCGCLFPPAPAFPAFFLDTIEETYNNGPPLDKKRISSTLDLVKKILRTFASDSTYFRRL